MARQKPRRAVPPNPPLISSAAEGQSAIALEAMILRREHRIIHAIHNWWTGNYEKNDPRQAAVKWALLWSVVSFRNAGGTGIGIASFVAIWFAYRANTLIEDQNKKIDHQNSLTQQGIEANKREAFRTEAARRRDRLDRIVEKVSQYIESQVEAGIARPEAGWTLPELLTAQVVELSASLAPHDIRQYSGDAPTWAPGVVPDPIPDMHSQERGRLLLFLNLARADLTAIPLVIEFADLSGLSFDGLRLGYGTNLTGASLVGTVFQNADLSHSRFLTVNLRFAKFLDCRLANVGFMNCELIDAAILDSDLNNSSFSECTIENTDILNCSLREAKLDRATIARANLSRCDFTSADLTDSRIDTCTLFGCKFDKCVLTGANFAGSQLGPPPPLDPGHPAAKFFDAINAIAEMSGMTLEADFRGAIGLTTEQIKAATLWYRALYDQAFVDALGLTPELLERLSDEFQRDAEERIETMRKAGEFDRPAGR